MSNRPLVFPGDWFQDHIQIQFVDAKFLFGNSIVLVCNTHIPSLHFRFIFSLLQTLSTALTRHFLCVDAGQPSPAQQRPALLFGTF